MIVIKNNNNSTNICKNEEEKKSSLYSIYGTNVNNDFNKTQSLITTTNKIKKVIRAKNLLYNLAIYKFVFVWFWLSARCIVGLDERSVIWYTPVNRKRPNNDALTSSFALILVNTILLFERTWCI